MAKGHAAKPKRKRCVLDVRGKHRVSQRALAHICNDLKTHGMVTASSRSTIQRNRRAFADRDTPFGTVIQTRPIRLKSGGCISPPFLHPAAMLWVCCEDCPEFKAFFSSCLKGRPLKLVMYADEVTPGRELLAYNQKKLWVLYWSFLDFGQAALSNEDAWFTGMVLRSNIVKNKIAGGLAHVLKVYSKMFFQLKDGCDFRRGIQLNVAPAGSANRDSSLVFAYLAKVIQDAEAHAIMMDWKGSGSIKC